MILLVFILQACALIAAADFVLLPRCTTHCDVGDSVTSSTTCHSERGQVGSCTNATFDMGGTTHTIAFVQVGSSCVGPSQCVGTIGSDGLCYFGSSQPYNTTSNACPSGTSRLPGGDCFPSTSSPCADGTFDPASHTCVTSSFMMWSCPTSYTLQNGICERDYTATFIMQQTQCGQIPSSAGCQWCSGITVCIPNNISCPITCPQAPTALCTLPPSRCQWCNASSSIGVCQNKTGTCWDECLPASDDPLSPALCNSSAACRWCSALGYCTPLNSTCHTNCTTVAPDRPAICQVQSIQAQCQWCGGTNNDNGFQYCVAANDEQRLRCAMSCTGLIWREDVCVGAPSCHWCGVHGGRCKPRRSSVYVGWRREVECDTESESSSTSPSPRLSDTATLTCSISRNTATPSVTFSITSSTTSSGSMTATLSGDASSTVSPSCSRTPTITQTLSTTSTVAMTLSESARTFTNELTLTLSAAANSITIESSASFRRATASASASHERTRTSTNSFTHSLSPSRTTTFSRSSTQSTQSLSTSISRPASISCSQSMSTRSISSSYRLPPCTTAHASLINAVWPKLFHVITNETVIRLIGFQRTLVVTDIALPLNNYIPLFLLNGSAVTGRFAYTPPVPYTTPNIDGLVNRNSIDAKVRWINDTTIELTIAPIPSYAINLDEDATIDISFELLELCNRHDAASIPMPDVVSLISVHVASLSGDNTFQAAAQPVSIISYLSGLLSGDPSSATSMQTLAVLGMQSCGQPAVRQALNNVRTLNPLYAGVDGLIGVIVGNVVLVVGAVLLSMLSVGAARAVLDHCFRPQGDPRMTFIEACCIVRAPSMVIAVVYALYQGTFFAASQVLTLADSGPIDRVISVFAFCALFAIPFIAVWWCASEHCSRDCFLFDYKSSKLHQIFQGMIGRLFLPSTKIEPRDVSRRFTVLVSSYRHQNLLLPILPIAVPFGVSIISLWHPDSSLGCRIYFWLLCAVHLAVLSFVVVLRPFRFMFDNVLFVTGTLINFALLLCMVVAMENPRFLTTAVAAQIGTAQIGFQVASSCCKVWSVFAQLTLLDDVPIVFLWTTRRAAPALVAVEDEVVIVEPEIDEPEDPFVSLLHLEETAVSFALIGDKDQMVTELEDIFTRFDSTPKDEDDDVPF